MNQNNRTKLVLSTLLLVPCVAVAGVPEWIYYFAYPILFFVFFGVMWLTWTLIIDYIAPLIKKMGSGHTDTEHR